MAILSRNVEDQKQSAEVNRQKPLINLFKIGLKLEFFTAENRYAQLLKMHNRLIIKSALNNRFKIKYLIHKVC